jgi:hypothetical protein
MDTRVILLPPRMETVGLGGHVDDARQSFATRGRLTGLHVVSGAISSALMAPYGGVVHRLEVRCRYGHHAVGFLVLYPHASAALG